MSTRPASEEHDMATVDPTYWQPAVPPELAQPNDLLDSVEEWPCPGGPEDVVLDDDGNLYAGVEDGTIWRFPAGGGVPSEVANTGGRPLGVELGRQGTLVVCDGERGLLWIEVDNGVVHELVTEFHGRVLRFVNNASVARDGTVYFTESSTRFGLENWLYDMLESRPNGRLLAFHPDRDVELIRDGLFFANGVALSPDESFLVVAESSRNRLLRVELEGSRRGDTELFARTPGHPDNVSLDTAGRFWVALPNRPDPRLRFMAARPVLRRVTAALPDRLRPQPERYGLVVAYDADGNVVANLHGPSGTFPFITGVRVHGRHLYLGSLRGDSVARVELPAHLTT